jgi:hypothetical protein
LGQAMTVVRHDWVSANKFSPERSGREIYAPPDRRMTEQLSNADHVTPLRPQTNGAPALQRPSAKRLHWHSHRLMHLHRCRHVPLRTSHRSRSQQNRPAHWVQWSRRRTAPAVWSAPEVIRGCTYRPAAITLASLASTTTADKPMRHPVANAPDMHEVHAAWVRERQCSLRFYETALNYIAPAEDVFPNAVAGTRRRIVELKDQLSLNSEARMKRAFAAEPTPTVAPPASGWRLICRRLQRWWQGLRARHQSRGISAR